MNWLDDAIKTPTGKLPPGVYLADGGWVKVCSTCAAVKPIETDYYLKRSGGVEFECKACLKARTARNKAVGRKRALIRPTVTRGSHA